MYFLKSIFLDYLSFYIIFFFFILVRKLEMKIKNREGRQIKLK
jgi:hypothetical protein